MPIEKENKTILSERYVSFILISLLKNGEINLDKFKSTITVLGTLTKIMNSLENEGLVQKRVLLRPHKTTFYKLTDKGLEVSKALNVAEELLSEKKDFTSSKSINHSVSDSIIQSPTLIKILVAVQNNPGITMGELTKVFGKGDLRNTIHDAENEKYIFECDMGRSDGKSGYYLTAKGVDLIGSRTFSKNVGDVIEMDCNASSSEENMARR